MVSNDGIDQGGGATAQPEAVVADQEPTILERRREKRARARRIIPAAPLRSGFLIAIGVLLAIALAMTVMSLSSVLLSIFLSLFIALGLDPLVRQLQRLGMKRSWGITTVAVAFLVLVALILLIVVPNVIRQLVHAIQEAPEALAQIQASDWYANIEAALGVDLDAIVADALGSLNSLASFLAISGGVLKAGASVVSAISSTVIIVVLTLYFVSSIESMKLALGSFVPQYKRATFLDLTDQIVGSVGGFVAGGVTLSAINAGVVLVLQLVIGSNIAMLLAIFAFFITLVPMIGSVIFMFVGTISALFIGPWQAVIFLVGYFAYIQIEAYFVTPRIMGKAVAVPGVLVIIGAMVGATLMGLLGALVAIPITASLLIIIRQVVIPAQNSKTIAPEV